MKSITTLSLFILWFSTTLFAQSIPYEVVYNKVKQPALRLDLPYTPNTSEDFIIQTLKRSGHDPESRTQLFWKQNKIDGFYVFKNLQLEGLQKPVDLYFRVDQKSKRLKDQSIIYMLIAVDNHFITSESDEKAYATAKQLLDSFTATSAAYKMELDVRNQEHEVKDAEVRLNKLQQEESELNKKMAQLQEELKRNKSSQTNQQMAIDSERRKLADLKTKGLSL